MSSDDAFGGVTTIIASSGLDHPEGAVEYQQGGLGNAKPLIVVVFYNIVLAREYTIPDRPGSNYVLAPLSASRGEVEEGWLHVAY